MSKESLPTGANKDGRKSEEVGGSGIALLESMAGEFDPDAASRLRDEVRDQDYGAGSIHTEGVDTDMDEESEAASSIDYSCFDRLNDDSFASLSKEQRAKVLAQCEQVYDASLEEFARLGKFSDPETGRYNGDTCHDGMDGAKRGVNYIVQCSINEEYYQRQVDELEKELAGHTGFYLFGRKKHKDARREISKKIERARSDLKHAREWPDHIGKLAFGSMEKWQSDEIQSKYRHMVQMKKDIIRVKYPWTNNGE